MYHHTVTMDDPYSISTDLTRLPQRLAGIDVFPAEMRDPDIFAVVKDGEGFSARDWRVVTLELCPLST